MGDPTEGALVVAARKAGLDESALRDAFPRRDEIAFTLAARGMRVLGVATARVVANPGGLEGGAWRGELRFLGVVGMADPPLADAIEAVRACQRAGIVVKMGTGDHAETARAIGRIVGLLDPGGGGADVVTGRRIEAASDLARAESQTVAVTTIILFQALYLLVALAGFVIISMEKMLWRSRPPGMAAPSPGNRGAASK